MDSQAAQYRTYNCRDVKATGTALNAMLLELREYGLEEYFYEVVMPLSNVVRKMQNRGIQFDKELAKTYSVQLRERAVAIREMLSNGLGVDNFNPNSPTKVANFLYGELGLKAGKRTKSGAYPTDDITLRKVALASDNDIMQLVLAILEYRKLVKLDSTYLQVEPWEDGRIRARWLQHGTATGRLACREPNLQNLPSRGVDKIGIDIKICYKAKEGHILLCRDYSQLEARIAAYLSECKPLIELYANKGDFHDTNARILWSIAAGDKVSKDQRRYAKEFAFAVTYGGGADTIRDRALKNELIISRPQAVNHVERLMLAYPELKVWREKQYEEAQRTKRVDIPLGGMRLLFGDDIRGQSFNTPIQGCAAAIINRAMIRIDNRLPGTIIIQEHDKLILEVHEDKVDSYDAVLQEEMEKPVTLNGYTVVLPTDKAVAKTWGDL